MLVRRRKLKINKNKLTNYYIKKKKLIKLDKNKKQQARRKNLMLR